MKKLAMLVLGALVLALGVQVAASAEGADVGCATAQLEWSEHGPLAVSIDRDPGVRADVVGHFLVLQYLSDGGSDSDRNRMSVEIEDGAGTVTGCVAKHDVAGPDIAEGEDAAVSVAVVPVVPVVPDEGPPVTQTQEDPSSSAVAETPVAMLVVESDEVHLVDVWVRARGGYWIV